MSKTNDSSSHISQSSGLWFTFVYQTTWKNERWIDLHSINRGEYISFPKKIKVDEHKSRKNSETLSLNFEIRFIDSFKFLETYLANLVSNLQPSDFKNTKAIIKDNAQAVCALGLRWIVDVEFSRWRRRSRNFPGYMLYISIDIVLFWERYPQLHKLILI